MKICVYAIAKNEEQFVDRWMDSMREADWVCVLDTGSTDRTVEKLADRGAVVRQEAVSPWRFDAARNRSMELIPPDTDICVCTDLDEVFRPGWRKLLENAWEPGAEQLRYTYIWSFGPRGTPGTTFLQEKIHAPGVFRWHHPVHEVLRRTDGQRYVRRSCWSTIRTRRKAGRSICRCWNCPSGRIRRTTGTPTIWGGSICSTDCTRRPSRC